MSDFLSAQVDLFNLHGDIQQQHIFNLICIQDKEKQ